LRVISSPKVYLSSPVNFMDLVVTWGCVPVAILELEFVGLLVLVRLMRFTMYSPLWSLLVLLITPVLDLNI